MFAVPQAVFHSVWYRDHEKGVLEFIIPFLTFAHMTNGTLQLRPGRLDFVGGGRFAITRIRRVSYGKCGIDLILNWVRIDYDDDVGQRRVAYFADGGALGWSGVFGGTQRLLEAIEAIVLASPRARADNTPDVLPADDILDVQRADEP
jgi:hypothetical protein